MATMAVVNKKNAVMFDHVERAVHNSDCRTPVIFVLEDGDPFFTLYTLAKEVQSSVWVYDLSVAMSAQNAMDYVEVGIQNGDWVYFTHCESVPPEFFREVARTIYLLSPDPRSFPRRELFRAFFSVDHPFDVESSVGLPFPPILLKSSIMCRKKDEDSKLSKKLPAEDALFAHEQEKHAKRREEGRESDSESDVEEHQPHSGQWFYRSTELYKNLDDAPLLWVKDELAKAIVSENVEAMTEILKSGEVTLTSTVKEGMTPLQYACALQKLEVVRALLDMGADPNEPRKTDGRPPLFMSITEPELAEMLYDAGADVHKKFHGYRADNHPDTHPDVALFLREARLLV